MYNKYTTEQLLIEARALVEKGWCQGASARNDRGMLTEFFGNKAVTFCMSGALCRLMNPVLEPWRKANDILASVVGCGIGVWNDRPERTQAEVLEAFDNALAIVRGSAKVEG
jgi:hypothetical protein